MKKKTKEQVFKHGQDGTHYACMEMIRKWSVGSPCCGCNGHNCKPTQEKQKCKHCLQDLGIRNPSGWCAHEYE